MPASTPRPLGSSTWPTCPPPTTSPCTTTSTVGCRTRSPTPRCAEPVAPARRRLDAELVHRGLSRSREHARQLVEDGRVLVANVVATKPATQVDAGASIKVTETDDGPDYVSRGAHKLVGALDAFGLDVAGRHALDAGASTGGFTDVLLRRGVAAVVAVDVGYGQLAWPVRSDERVTVLDRTNVRALDVELLPFRPDLVVGDLSFISLTLVLA